MNLLKGIGKGAGTPNAHFSGLSLIWNRRKLANVFFQVFQQGTALLCLHHNVFYIDVGISAELFQEAFLHATLKIGTGISQAECHSQVAESSEWCDEGGLQAVGWIQLDLMVA